MKLAFQIAYKNLISAGLRTWLNVIVLAFTFIMIIFFNGMLDGWNQQAKRDSIEWEFGQGQLVHQDYDKYDPFTIQDGHDKNPNIQGLTPVLIRQASIYPEGRMVPTVIKGIPADQTVVNLPTEKLQNTQIDFPILIGERMAKSNNLVKGDEILIRWKDKNGTFDARKATVAYIFDTDLSTVDKGQIWMSMETMNKITGFEDEATLFIADESYTHTAVDGWKFETQDKLLSSITEIIAAKKVSASILYILLLVIALLAVFDTQVLSIFRRQKEIGTYVALGMTRLQVMGLFTFEGTMYSILAMIVGVIFGAPIFYYFTTQGIPMNTAQQDIGVALADIIYPIYSISLFVFTIFLIAISSTIVSFIPAMKIAKMNPVEALKGKLQ